MPGSSRPPWRAVTTLTRPTLGGVADSLTRTSAFVVKEGVQVLRQPRLLAIVVLGPFAVLVAFGLGFSSDVPRYRTVVVAPEGSGTGPLVERFVHELDEFVDYQGLVRDRDAALERLGRGDVQVVAVLPADAYGDLQADRRAIIEIYHQAIDPVSATAIDVVARFASDEINRQVLTGLVADGQGTAALMDESLPAAQAGLAEVRGLLEAGDQAGGELRLETLLPSLERVSDDVTDRAEVVDPLQGPGAPPNAAGAADQLDRSVRALTEGGTSAELSNRLAQVRAAEEALADARSRLDDLADVDPGVLVRPFRTVTERWGDTPVRPLDFYAPSALILLLQHLAITFPALSLVRDRDLGTTELLAAAPLSAAEALAGKATSFLALGGAVGVLLSAACHWLLGVPLVGSVGEVAVVGLAVLASSLGIGFLISLLARTDTQAVQLTMIVLLASFFFSGFFLPLDRLGSNVTWVSDLLPATYGIRLTRDVALRGWTLEPGQLVGPALVMALTFGASWLLLRRRLRAV